MPNLRQKYLYIIPGGIYFVSWLVSSIILAIIYPDAQTNAVYLTLSNLFKGIFNLGIAGFGTFVFMRLTKQKDENQAFQNNQAFLRIGLLCWLVIAGGLMGVAQITLSTLHNFADLTNIGVITTLTIMIVVQAIGFVVLLSGIGMEYVALMRLNDQNYFQKSKGKQQTQKKITSIPKKEQSTNQ